VTEPSWNISLTVNGVQYAVEAEPRKLLADLLREDLGLTGTHIGCEQGVCGACTVLVDGRTARSCLMFGVQADGANVTTVEGIAADDALHPLQTAFTQHHALQCGFCTPGMLITSLELLERTPHPTADDVRVVLSGNLCRCTGYQNIIAAVLAAADAMEARES
jgi:aerobic carbon-monoxide dehydrogenase small subunit